jgi:SNF2 family DNA or RNA helicase
VGGVGLTLTSADRVVLVEPGWSPAIDLQAADRCHRVGQTKPVVVYRLVGHAALEDKVRNWGGQLLFGFRMWNFIAGKYD